MNSRLLAVVSLLVPALIARGAQAQTTKPRVVVLTDVSNEPDDEESLVRYLVYANEFETEGMIATTSTWLRTAPREDLIRRDIAAYDSVRANLVLHAPGYPTAASLLAVTATGQPGYGMAFVGPGKGTDGSRRIIEAADRDDPRPLWVTVWGGANTLAQALVDVRATRTPAELARFVERLRVYTISDQDDAGQWLRTEFPSLFYIVSPSAQEKPSYATATWTGISGDRHYKLGPRPHFDMVDNPWLVEHVIERHGPLGALYPKLAYIMEGDTPSFLGLIDNGLGWATSPTYGGWGGRYALITPAGEPRPIWSNDNVRTADAVTVDGRVDRSDQATIWRWREHFQNDFAARMNWCVADAYAKANHNPIAVVNGDRGRRVLTFRARRGSSIMLSSKGTSDPDGNAVRVRWWIYREAGTLSAPASLSAQDGAVTAVRIPRGARAGTVHVILQVEDEGTPRLVAYRRTVIEVRP